MSSRLKDEAILMRLEREGYAIVEDVVDAARVRQLKSDLEVALEAETLRHGSEHTDHGMVLVCCTYARSFVDILGDAAVMAPINHILGDGCIVYAYTSSSMPPGGSNYSARIHVDCPRMIPGYETNAGFMILLDDFTEANGATWLLPGSHRTREAPAADFFFANARRLVASAGSVVYLNPRIWHAGGQNTTGTWRHSITVSLCRPYMKQRLDIPKMMGASNVDLAGVSETSMQKMGFYAQVPESLDEYYLPREQRKFRQKAE